MIVGGYQPLTLIDFPGHIAAIIFTKGCNFRCPYCHNPELVEPEDWEGVAEKTLFNFLKKRRPILSGVVVTGGEPTLHKDLPDLIRKVKDMGYHVKLDTNGTNPEMVKRLFAEELIDYVAMDLKHTWEKYQTVAHVADGKSYLLENVQKTAELIRNSGKGYEWRTTLFPAVHTTEDINDIVSWMRPGETYFLQEMRYGKTLRKGLDQSKTLDAKRLVDTLRQSFPKVNVTVR